MNTRSEAEAVLQKLKDGQSFAGLAKQYSVSDQTRDEGGFVGLMRTEDLRDEYRIALRGIAPGDTTGIITLASNFALLHLDQFAKPARSPNTTAIGVLFHAEEVVVALKAAMANNGCGVTKQLPSWHYGTSRVECVRAGVGDERVIAEIGEIKIFLNGAYHGFQTNVSIETKTGKGGLSWSMPIREEMENRLKYPRAFQ